MALRQSDMNEVVLGTGDLSLQALEGESLLVKDVLTAGGSAAHMQITVGQRTVFDARITGALGNHTAFPPGFTNTQRGEGLSLFRKLYEMGIWRGIPVPSGYTLTLTGVAQANAVQMVVYARYDEGDIQANAPNGPEGGELDYLIYGTSSASITTATDTELSTVVNGSEFDAFPFGANVPANTDITLYGILASTFAPSQHDGTDDIGTSYLKLTRQRTVLGDKNRAGYLLYERPVTESADQVGAGQSAIGNYNDVDSRLPFFWPEPLVFNGGEELLVELSTVIAGSGETITVTECEVAFIARQARS